MWKDSLFNQLRLNVNVGCNVSKNKFSVAIVIRNFQGRVLGAKACMIRYPDTVKGA